MKLFLLVCLGGALGSGLRYGTDMAFKKASPEFAASFPYSTLCVNLLGCLIVGLGFGWLTREGEYVDELRALLLIGFCGGLTTFSTFANQTLAEAPGKAMINVAVSVVGCLFMAWVGLTLSGAR